VVHGVFESIPEADGSYDVVWSQDAILHSDQRERVLGEVARVLRPGGVFVFTDPMQTDDAPASALTPILNRIHLDSLGSPGFYREAFARHGFEEVAFIEKTEQLKNHYGAVAQVLKSRYDEMVEKCSQNYVDNMLRGLGHWVEGAERGHLVWGIFHFRHTG
jgi:sarcosine/dimethylglycine N-methyltransferase